MSLFTKTPWPKTGRAADNLIVKNEDNVTPCGLFVTLEGGEGSGKSTVSQLVVDKLINLGIPAVLTSEPGASSIGPVVEALVLGDRDTPLTERTETLLLLAVRAQHVEEVVRPSIATGVVVVCDRFIDSTLAYQGGARGLPMESIKEMSLWASRGLWPDVTFLLDVEPEIGLSRRHFAGNLNHLDREDIQFHRSVRQAYHKISEIDRARYVGLDATKPREELTEQIVQEILLRQRRKLDDQV